MDESKELFECDLYTLCHYYIILQGLKTGMYYLRTRPAANAIQFTVDQKAIQEAKSKQEKVTSNGTHRSKEEEAAALACSLQNREACIMCSS